MGSVPAAATRGVPPEEDANRSREEEGSDCLPAGREAQHGPQVMHQRSDCGLIGHTGASGFTQVSPGKRAKSRSVVYSVAPCSIASAASAASITRGPVACP